MTGKEVRALSDEEVKVELDRLREKLFGLRGQTVTEKVEDNSQFGKVRKDIARLLTERKVRLNKVHKPAARTKPEPKAAKPAPGRKPAAKAAAGAGKPASAKAAAKRTSGRKAAAGRK
jgi:large subunit ribosomal protein L29